MSDLVRWLGLIVLCVAACGCAHVKYKDFQSTTFLKDVAAKARIPQADGSVLEVDVTSNVNADLVRAAAEGAARGAIKP